MGNCDFNQTGISLGMSNFIEYKPPVLPSKPKELKEVSQSEIFNIPCNRVDPFKTIGY